MQWLLIASKFQVAFNINLDQIEVDKHSQHSRTGEICPDLTRTLRFQKEMKELHC